MASINPYIIPDFSYDLEIRAMNGRHDRIAVDAVQCWQITGRQSQISAFREMLTGWSPSDGDGQRLVGQQTSTQPRFARWSIAGSAVEGETIDIGDPLIWGLLEANLATGGVIETWLITARLTLNPTKWVSQQSARLTMLPSDQWLQEPSNMFAWKEPFSVAEIPLVRSPNVFVGMPREMLMIRPESWGVQLHRYIRDAVSLLHANLGRVAALTDVQMHQRAIDLRLKEAEIYWEFWSERPLEEMARIEASARTVASSSNTAWWPISDEAADVLTSIGQIEVGVEDNSPRVSMRLAQGTALRIYAKTSKRLRFEVAYKAPKARAVFPRRSFASPDELSESLVNARLPAADRLGRIFDAIRLMAVETVDRKAPHELISEILTIVEGQLGRDLVSMLISCGRIAAYPDLSFHAELVRLKRRGVLRTLTRAGNDFLWTVTPAYRSALLALRTRRWNVATVAPEGAD